MTYVVIIAKLITFAFAALGWSLAGAGLAFSRNKPTKITWKYGLVALFIGMMVSWVAFL